MKRADSREDNACATGHPSRDSWLVGIDVQGGLPGEAALAVAGDLGVQQGACLAAGGVSEELTVPEELRARTEATPPVAAIPAS